MPLAINVDRLSFMKQLLLFTYERHIYELTIFLNFLVLVMFAEYHTFNILLDTSIHVD